MEGRATMVVYEIADVNNAQGRAGRRHRRKKKSAHPSYRGTLVHEAQGEGNTPIDGELVAMCISHSCTYLDHGRPLLCINVGPADDAIRHKPPGRLPPLQRLAAMQCHDHILCC